MVEIVLFSLVYLFFIINDLIPLYQKKKAFYTYSGLLLGSYILNCLVILDKKLPSPAISIKAIILAIFGLSD